MRFRGTLVVVVLLLARTAAALDAGQRPFAIRRWERSDGVQAVAQGPDGMLWFGSLTGLSRFDGDRFVEVDLDDGQHRAPTSVRRVLAARDGSLWLATGGGELEMVDAGGPHIVTHHIHPRGALLHVWPYRPDGDQARIQQVTDGLPDPWVWALAEDPDGGIWLGTESGLVHLVGGRAERFTTSDGLPANLVTALTFGPDGALTVGTSGGVVVRRAGRFQATPVREPVLAVVVDRAGRLWAGTHTHVAEVDAAGRLQVIAREDEVRALALDRDDNVWINPVVLFPGGDAAKITGVDAYPLGVMDLLVDREGSLWVANREGTVIQVSTPRVRAVGPDEGLPGVVAFSVLGLRDGSVLATTNEGVSRLAAGVWTHWSSGDETGFGPKDIAEGAPGAANAGVWLASSSLRRGGPQGFRTVARHSDTDDKSSNFRSVVAARNGDLWVSHVPPRLYQFRGGDLSRPAAVYAPAAGVCGGELTHGTEGADGSIWFVGRYRTDADGATRIKDGRARCYRTADGLPTTQIGAVTTDREGTIWLGTGWGAGLVRFRDERFAVVPAAAGLPRSSINGLIDDGRGHLWLCSETGVWQVSKAELNRCADGPCPPLNPVMFGKAEGMRTPECIGAFHPNMTVDGGGNVWVATLRGVHVFPPPERAQRPVLAPLIEQIVVDGIARAVGESVRLGPRNVDLVVRYTAASFLPGIRPALRHRIRGFDADWVAGGSPAVAHYHALPAGTHRLELAVGDGFRHLLTIDVEPPFWRTRSFVAFLVVTLAALALGLHRLSVARLTLRHRAVTEERARIARDLHDGLSQKLTAIGLLGDRAGSDGQQVQPEQLLQLRQIVGEAHAELRRAIWDMRDGTGGRERLETLIERALAGAVLPPGTKLTLQTSAASLPVPMLMAQEAPLIVKEAVVNAVRHARARRIEVGVLSDEDGVHVWVVDDGRGMAAGQTGGYGLIGMHERARRLGGALTIRSEPGSGTEVSLFVPRIKRRPGEGLG